MKLGHSVPGIMTEGVFFVVDDQYNIHQRVKDYDPDSALVCNVEDQHSLGIARFVRDEQWAPGGAWVIAFWCNDQVTGDRICGEADARILELQKDFDTRSRGHAEKTAHRIRMALMMREYRQAAKRRELAGDLAEKTVNRWQKARGLKHKIFVPAGVNGD